MGEENTFMFHSVCSGYGEHCLSPSLAIPAEYFIHLCSSSHVCALLSCSLLCSITLSPAVLHSPQAGSVGRAKALFLCAPGSALMESRSQERNKGWGKWMGRLSALTTILVLIRLEKWVFKEHHLN